MNTPLAIEPDGLGYKIIRDSIGNAIAYRVGVDTAIGIVEAVNGYATLKAQLDDLLAAAKKVRLMYIDSTFGFGGGATEAAIILQAAIAKAEGSER